MSKPEILAEKARGERDLHARELAGLGDLGLHGLDVGDLRVEHDAERAVGILPERDLRLAARGEDVAAEEVGLGLERGLAGALPVDAEDVEGGGRQVREGDRKSVV